MNVQVCRSAQGMGPDRYVLEASGGYSDSLPRNLVMFSTLVSDAVATKLLISGQDKIAPAKGVEGLLCRQSFAASLRP